MKLDQWHPVHNMLIIFVNTISLSAGFALNMICLTILIEAHLFIKIGCYPTILLSARFGFIKILFSVTLLFRMDQHGDMEICIPITSSDNQINRINLLILTEAWLGLTLILSKFIMVAVVDYLLSWKKLHQTECCAITNLDVMLVNHNLRLHTLMT